MREDGGLFRVDSGSEEKRGKLPDLGLQLRGLLIGRDGVQIYDAEETLIVILNLYPVAERAQVITDV